MKQTISAAVFLGLVATSGAVLAHEGHHHDAMGTVVSLEDQRLDLEMSDDETMTFVLTEETLFKRGEEVVSSDDIVAGERAVVMYETRDGVNAAVEVKLGPKAE